MIEEGQPAPDFSLLDGDGREVSLATLRGEWAVLYFYPRDNTPGCTTQACDFRDAEGDLRAVGARVIGISPDGAASHARFAAKHRLPFTLLSDPEGELSRRFGVWVEKNFYGKKKQGIARTTFLLDRNGIVRKVFPKVKVPGHAVAVLNAIKSFG